MWVDVHVSAFPGVWGLYIFTRFPSTFCISVDETLSSGTSTSFFGLETFLCVTYFTMCSFLFLFFSFFSFFLFSFLRVICLFCGLLFFCCYLFFFFFFPGHYLISLMLCFFLLLLFFLLKLSDCGEHKHTYLLPRNTNVFFKPCLTA